MRIMCLLKILQLKRECRQFFYESGNFQQQVYGIIMKQSCSHVLPRLSLIEQSCAILRTSLTMCTRRKTRVKQQVMKGEHYWWKDRLYLTQEMVCAIWFDMVFFHGFPQFQYQQAASRTWIDGHWYVPQPHTTPGELAWFVACSCICMTQQNFVYQNNLSKKYYT